MLAVIGLVVAVVAVVALHDPRSGGVGNAGKTVGVTDTASAPRTSAKPSPLPSPSKTGSTSAPALHLGSSSAGSSASDSAHAVPLVVLNNTTIPGLAAQAAARFERGGWTVSSSGNLTNTILSTCAYYDPSVNGAEAAAEELRAQYPTIKRVEQKFPQLPSGPIVVVLTPDYTSG